MFNKDTEELDDLFHEMDDDYFIESDKQAADVNELARLFYYTHGYQVEKGYDFESAKHPQERLMYRLAVQAFNYVKSREGQ